MVTQIVKTDVVCCMSDWHGYNYVVDSEVMNPLRCGGRLFVNWYQWY